MDSQQLIMASVAQIAERDGITRQAVSKAVGKLIVDNPDMPVERSPSGRVMRISLAHYDHHRQRFVNPAKAAAPIRALSLPPAADGGSTGSDSFEEARRQAEWLKVGREKIRHQEECSQLLRKDKIDEAHRIIGAELQSIIRRLPNRADDLALAVSKEGVHGARSVLRQIAFELGNQMADKLDALTEAAPESDPLIAGDDD